MENKGNSNTNVTSVSESGPSYGTIREHIHRYAITFRPCENKIVSLGHLRKKYGAYNLVQQKQILENVILYANDVGLKFTNVNFETTKTMHFHCFLEFSEMATFYALQERALLLNSRYGPKTYKAFDYQEAYDNAYAGGYKNWQTYIEKDCIHPISEWCKNI